MLKQIIEGIEFIYYKFEDWKKRRTALSLWNTSILILLSIIGIAFMYAIQKDSTVLHFKWKLQIIWLCLGLIIYYVTSSIHYKVFLQNAHWIYIFSIFLLLLLWTPIGKTLGGSRRWLNLGFINVQPSDFNKLATLLMVASILTRTQMTTIRDSFRVLVEIFIISCISFGLIFLQPDLGSAMVLPAIIFGLLFISKLSLKFFGIVFLTTLFGIGLITLDVYGYYQRLKGHDSKIHSFLPLKDYQRNRILAFTVPTSIDPKGVHVGWHLKQSLIAIGSGGIFGKGWTKNTQAQLGYLPKAASLDDFIFSVLAEETGLLGTYFVLVLYCILIFNTFRIATMARDRFGCYLSVGVALLLFTHVWINMGMTLGIMPITGLPLPFLSYGGSFMIVCFFSQGLVQSVYRFRFAE